MTTTPSDSITDQLYRNSGLSRNQIRLWMGQQLDPGSPLYNTVFAFKITGDLDPDAFHRAWQTVIDGHPVLRLNIRMESGKPIAATHPEGSCTLQREDLSSCAAPDEEFRKWSRARAAKALPLSGELVDSVLVKLDAQCHGWYLNQHHLITDAVSTIKLVELVFQALDALAGGMEAPASAPHYLETIESVQRAAYSRMQSSEDYFRNRPATRFPQPEFLGRSTSARTTAAERLTLQFSPEESERLRQITAKPPFSSLFKEMSLLAGFSTILSAWIFHLTGQKAFRFDMPVANRTTPASRKALGLFLEMFPLCVNIVDGETFASLGKQCLAETQSLLKACGPGSSFIEHSDASSAVLNYFPQPFRKAGKLELESEWVYSGHCDSVHAFQLQVHDYNATGAFTLYLDFNKAVFSGLESERGCFLMRSIINAFLEDPDSCIENVVTLAPQDERKFLIDFNATADSPLPDRTVIDHFLGQVASTPELIAVRDGRNSHTYAELGKKVSVLAATLQTMGIGRGSVVPVFMRRSTDVVTAILAVLSTGAAYVPLDPGYPPLRISYILDDCGAALVLTHRGFGSRLADFSGRVLDLEEMEHQVAGIQGSTPTLKDQAYMIYTSGSTGQPKGVPIDHDGLADYLEWASREYVRGDQLAFPLFTSLSFDLTVTSLFLPLITGGTLVVYEESDGPVDSAVVDVINDNQVDVIKLTPSHLALLQQLDLSSSRIRRMILGGEDLKVHIARTITERFGKPVEIFNEYGPTEAVVGCMIHKFDPGSDTGISVPIGVPADHVQLYVVNSSINPVPPGVPGELCIARHGLTRGYHGRAGLNAEKFIPNPWRQGEYLYRTGDLVRFNERGLLEYLGRIDRQLKVSGFRIEPGEIERCLTQFAGIEACVVTSYHPLDTAPESALPQGDAKPEQDAGKDRTRVGRLAAYYVSQGTVKDTDLTNYLSSRLPDQLIPHRFIALPGIPLTPNGKTDFSALPHPDQTAAAPAGEHVEPAGPVEEQVAEIWESVIGGGRIDANSNFFRMGGTSLAAMEAMLQICNAFEIELPLQTIFQESTVRRISAKIEEVLLQEISGLTDEEAERLAGSALDEREHHGGIEG